MKQDLANFYQKALEHKKNHSCGAVPYEYGDVLMALVAALKPKKILEVGTGIGYTAACMAIGYPNSKIETIEQHHDHAKLAQQAWQELGIETHINLLEGKAEAILPALEPGYDVIFYDGYVPQKKFLQSFERLLRPWGALLTANLFLRDPKGGSYLKNLQNEKKWTTGIFADTAISVFFASQDMV